MCGTAMCTVMLDQTDALGLARRMKCNAMQVKYSSSQSGTGGDWAVRITTSKLDSSLTDTLPKEQVPPGHKQPGRRLSLLIYMADTHWRSSSLDVVPEGDADRVGEVRL